MSDAPATPPTDTPPATPPPTPPAAPETPPAPTTLGTPPATPAPPQAWHALIQDADMRGDPFIQNLPTVDALAKEALTMLPLVGAEKVPKPPSDPAKWTDEQWNLHHTALGRPEKAAGYELSPEGLPEGSFDGDFEERFIESLHKAGLSTRAAQQVYNESKAIRAEQWNAQQATLASTVADAEKTLQGEWGAAYDAKMKQAHTAFMALAGDQAETLEGLPMANGARLGDSPEFIRLMAKMGESLAEDPNAGPAMGIGRRAFAMTADEAKQKIATFEFENQAAIYTAEHPGHAAAIQQRDALYQIAYPEPKE